MPPELRDEVLEWLAKARTDLRAAEVLGAGGQPLLGVACLECQQCAEKALKAFLVSRQTPFRKSHNLGYVLDLCAAIDGEFECLRPAAKVLTPYAWDFRYPGRRPDPDPDEAGEALRLAREVMRFAITRLPPEARET